MRSRRRRVPDGQQQSAGLKQRDASPELLANSSPRCRLPGSPLPHSLTLGHPPPLRGGGERMGRSLPLPRSGGGAFERMLGRGGGGFDIHHTSSPRCRLPGRPLPHSLTFGHPPPLRGGGERMGRSLPLPRSGEGAFERMLGRGGGFLPFRPERSGGGGFVPD
jgi:hypothetical protein